MVEMLKHPKRMLEFLLQEIDISGLNSGFCFCQRVKRLCPYGLEGWSPQLNLRAPGFLYVGVFLVAMSLSYKPVLVIWAGIATIITWTIGYLWVVHLPETVPFSSRDVLDRGLGIEAALRTILDPKAVGLARLSNQIVFLILVTVILTLTVWRSRRLVRRQVAAEAERGALSRYFSPNIVRELSTNSQSLDRPKLQPVAVLFADMVGFTAITERLSPDALVGLLREFHGRLAEQACPGQPTQRGERASQRAPRNQ